MPPPPRQRTRLPREVRRELIVDAAVTVFGRSGYRDGSMGAIAEVAGMTVPGVLHYFSSKEELLLATLTEREREQQSVFDAADGESTFDFGKTILERNLRQPGFMRLRVTLTAEATDPDHPAHAHMRDRYVDTLSGWTQRLTDDARTGRIPETVSPEAVAPAFIALLDGLQIQHLLIPDFDLIPAYTGGASNLLQLD